jgi:hypothetical protein
MNWWAAITLIGIFENRLPDTAALLAGLDAGSDKDQDAKARLLQTAPLFIGSQGQQLQNPDNIIVFDDLSDASLFADVGKSVEGLSTGDGDRFLRKFWEVPAQSPDWSYYHVTPTETQEYAGLEEMIHWQSGRGELSRSDAARIQGQPAWGRRGVLVSKMNKLKCTLYFGEIHDKMSAALIPDDPADVPALWAYCSSDKFHENVRKFSQKVDVATKTLAHVPFDRTHWNGVAAARYPGGLPPPSATEATSYLFSGNPLDYANPLAVAIPRLVGYRWPRQNGAVFPNCPAPLESPADIHQDLDGIVCLTATKGEARAHERVSAMLAELYGDDWSAAKLTSLLAGSGFAGKTVDDWLRDGFFAQHVELFLQRPFVWHIWDGRRDGFHALIDYHRLTAPDGEGRRTLEKLIYSYLGDWIDRQRSEQKNDVEGAEARLAHAEHLRDELIKILNGEPPYDVFVRWKPLSEQPIGWDPDPADGVRVNIRPFLTARPLGSKSKNACILRVTPAIRWDKDRGKEAERDILDFPWLWSWDGMSQNFSGGDLFDGNRWNDLHYDRAAKTAARALKAVSGSKAI